LPFEFCEALLFGVCGTVLTALLFGIIVGDGDDCVAGVS